MKSDLSNSITELQKTVRDYLITQVDIVRLSFLEKLTKIAVFFISSVVFLVIGTLIFVFAALTFVVWYESLYGNYLTGLLIVLGAVVALGILFIIFRNNFVTSRVLKKISTIILELDHED